MSIGYAFVTRNGSLVVEGDPQWDDEETLMLLIVKDSLSRAVFAHVVSKKGVDVDNIVDDVIWLRCAKAFLKSDNEPAIIKLLKESLAALKVSGLEQAGEEHSPPCDSQANGSVANAIK